MTATSNDNGRSLEFLIAKSLAERSSSNFTSRALIDQARDVDTLQRIRPGLRRSFGTAASLVADWVLETELKGSRAVMLIDRCSDSDHGVADMLIKCGAQELALSVKHNHDALSHPRPYSLVQWLGLPKGSPLDLDHRRRMQKVSNNFRKSSSGARLFSEVPNQKWELYREVCSESVSTLQTFIKAKGVARLFDHLVGRDFKKVIVRTDHRSQALKSVQIVDYSTVEPPKSLSPSVDEKQGSISMDIEFDNGWKVDMRIHNASSSISSSGQLSLKFDAQREFGPKLPSTFLFP